MMLRTADIATEAELRDLFSMDLEDGDLEDRIHTHDGDWVREGQSWVFFRHEGTDE